MAHLSNELFSLLMISYKVHVQRSCRREKNPCSIVGTKTSLQRCPAEGALANEPCPRSLCACTGEQNKDLNFDFLGGRELRDGFLDPQSCESGRRVDVPALSHQFAHHTERLACDTEEKTPFISLFKIYI